LKLQYYGEPPSSYAFNFSLRRYTKGTIPAALGKLATVTSLDMSMNSLTGAVLAEFRDLAALTTLDLNSNRLTSVPSELGNLSALISLKLTYNGLTSIPAALGKALNLEPMRPVLKAPGTQRLKLNYDEPTSNSAFKFNLRRYNTGGSLP
jgi:Leucine-rich repeat (LRR) protein